MKFLPIKPREEQCIDCPYFHLEGNHTWMVGARPLMLETPATAGAVIKYLMVGEAPGENEDLRGLPFVGASGQLLRKAINGIPGIEKEAIALTNSVRCRPPENKNPGVVAKRSCLPYLEDEIDAMPNLEVIIALGTQALTAMRPDIQGGVGQNRLKVLEFHGKPMVATFHPAAILYDRSKSPHLMDDLHAYLVSKVWSGTEERQTFPTRILNSNESGKQYIRSLSGEVGLDIETASFSDTVLSVGIYNRGGEKHDSE